MRFCDRLLFQTGLVACLAVAAARPAAGQQPAYVAIGKFEELSGATRSASGRSAVSDLQARFEAARRDASISDPARISRNLVALTADNKELIWRGEIPPRQVLAVVLTGYTGYDPLIGSATTLTRDVWVVMAPELKNFCATHSIPAEDVTLRLEQLIGLTPNGGRTRLVEMWISTDDLFRPSPDPEITDHEAQLDFPRSGRYMTISPDHVKWINDLKAVSYGENGYPWTRLGYTYDWGNPNSILGLSEFVAPGGVTVGINSVTAPANYCRPSGDSGPAVFGSDVAGLASGLGGAVAPGEFLSIAGMNLGSSQAPVRVTFNEVEAQTSYASGMRLNVLTPEQVRGRNTVALMVESDGVKSPPVSFPVVDSRPAIFTAGGAGTGPAVVVNQDNSMNSESNPAGRGSIVSFWATGMGTLFYGSSDTGPADVIRFPYPELPVNVSVGGVPATDVRFVGMVYPGVIQVNVAVPQSAPPGGLVEVQLSAGGATSRTGVTLSVR